MTFVDLISVVIAIVGLGAAIIARKIWVLLEGELAESWRWIMPSVPVYAISFIILIAHNFLRDFGVVEPVFKMTIDTSLLERQTVFSMQIWEPIILVLRNFQVLTETLFLMLVLMGLVRQFRLFQKLASKQD